MSWEVPGNALGSLNARRPMACEISPDRAFRVRLVGLAGLLAFSSFYLNFLAWCLQQCRGSWGRFHLYARRGARRHKGLDDVLYLQRTGHDHNPRLLLSMALAYGFKWVVVFFCVCVWKTSDICILGHVGCLRRFVIASCDWMPYLTGPGWWIIDRN